MECKHSYKVVLIFWWICCIYGQFTSLFGTQQGTQNTANDLLQQTMLSSLRSQANLLANMGVSRTSNPALDMLMSGLDAQRQAPASPPSNPAWPSMSPVDELLRQQRTAHTSLLQDILNTGRLAQNNNNNNNNNNPAQSAGDTTIVQGTGQPEGPFDNIRVVVFNGGQNPSVDSTSNAGSFPGNVQSGFSSSFTSGPNLRQFFENFVSGFSSSSGPGFDNSGVTSGTGFESSSGTSGSGIDSSGKGIGSSTVQVLPVQPQSPTSAPPNVVVVTKRPPISIQGPTILGPAPPSASRNQQPALTCSEEFSQIPGHTLCMDDNPGVTYTGVSIDDKLLITQFHNELRAKVQPPASDLLKLHWDNRLAAVAEKWAKQCTLAHDKERSIPEIGLSVGQNVAVGYDTWQIAIQQWYDEIRKYRYGFEPDSYLGPEGWREIAHFTQIVQNGTYLIGCGYAECPHTEYIRFYVCNYAAGQSDLAYPYTAGTQCGSCPNNCINGLCDCGNLVCRNKGKLDPGTCTCECPRPYKGKMCEIVDCPSQDNWICGRDWKPSYCDRFYNVPEECPHMCGLCGDTKGTPSMARQFPVKPVVMNTTFTSAFGCKYTGKRDDQQACQNYGDKGADMRMCASEGGNVGCSQCDRYFNIKKDYCPVMCGLCDPPCNGKKCLNGGSLDTATCTCQCRPPFTGDICQLAQCPVNGDPRFCNYWPVRYCDMYHNVPEECPVKCGICTDRTDPTGTGNEA